MSPNGSTRQSASFVRSGTGWRFRLVSEPARPRGTVIWAHAFAEEMNKSRRMCALMARALASDGWRVNQVDLTGCGDSSGELRDASWRAWVDDLSEELRHAEADLPCWLWGVRAGALFAADLAAQRSDLNLLLWQPALNGATVLQQFLRLHTGARIVGTQRDGASPAQLLKSGQTIEVGGYEITPRLAEGMQQARFDLPTDYTGRVIWLEVSATEPAAIAQPSREAAMRLQQRGIEVHQEAVTGPSFWQTQEIEHCEPLLQRTSALLAGETP